jgi:hypothetical protein
MTAEAELTHELGEEGADNQLERGEQSADTAAERGEEAADKQHKRTIELEKTKAAVKPKAK